MSTTNTKHTPPGAIALAYLTAELEHRLGNRTFSADNQREAAAADDDLRDLMTERESLADALARVTAQRDQCREALRVAEVAADQAAAYVADECPGAWGDAHSEALTSAAMQARAALRACDEKRSAEGASIAAEGGAK